MEEVHRLIAHVPDRYKPAVWLLVFAGLRPSELCGLRVRDVDFVRKEVRVRRTLMPVHRYDPTNRISGPQQRLRKLRGCGRGPHRPARVPWW